MSIKSIHEYSYYFYEVRYHWGKVGTIEKTDPVVKVFLETHELKKSRFTKEGEY